MKKNNKKLIDSVVDLYNVVTGEKLTIDQIINKARSFKIREPLVRKNKTYKGSILHGDIKESEFEINNFPSKSNKREPQ